jgi:hypothetical protein
MGRSVYKQPGTRVDEDRTTQKGGIPSNGEVSLQATWDQGGRGSHHTERRDSK